MRGVVLHLQHEKLLVRWVFEHGGVVSVVVGDVVGLDVIQHLQLLQIEQQFKPLTVVLHGQWAVQQGFPTLCAAYIHTIETQFEPSLSSMLQFDWITPYAVWMFTPYGFTVQIMNWFESVKLQIAFMKYESVSLVKV